MRRVWLAALGAGLLTSACIEGTGSGLTGIAGGTEGTPRTLAFTVQPSSANAAEIITPAVQVAARDSLGQVDAAFTGAVTVALDANPTGAFLDGSKTVVAVSGVASFGDLRIDRAGTGYTLRATASGATPATSAGFSIAAAP